MKHRMVIVLLAGLLLLSGCSQRMPKAPDLAPVQGKVILPDGRPARGALIQFHPDGSGGSDASVELNADGSFVLKTFGDREGVVPGKYRVSVNPNKAVFCSPADKQEGINSIPNHYWSEDTTDIIVEVKNEANTFTFNLR